MSEITVQELRKAVSSTEKTYFGLRNRRISLGGVRPSKAEDDLRNRLLNYRKALKMLEAAQSTVGTTVN